MRIHEFQCSVEVRNPMYLGEVLTGPRWDTTYTSRADVYLLVDGREELVATALFEKLMSRWTMNWSPSDNARKKAIEVALAYLSKEYPRGVPESTQATTAT